ncbi:hypothetical protein ACQ4LE_003574 [Meloidogyne hapla]
MMASCHHSKFIFIILFLIQILFNSILCPLPPPTRHLARNVIRIVLNLPEQPFSQHLNHNTSHEFKQTAENINEAFNLFWQTEPSYRGSRVIRLRYNQVLGTIATIDLIFELPLNTSIAVLHRLKWELMRALKDGRIGWINASVDGFEFTPVEGPFSSPTLACPDGSLPEFSIHGSTYCWSHSVCPSGTACEHGQCCKNAELTPRRNCDPIKEWECADGLCIPISFRCDGKEDCVLDVEERAFALGMLLHRPSDELYCPTGKLIV